MGDRSQKILMALALSLMMTGLVSIFLISSNAVVGDAAIQDIPLSYDSDIGSLDVQMLSIPMASGTSVLFPSFLTRSLTVSTVVAFAIGTVASERRSEDEQLSLRDRILIEIEANPGIHLRELQRSVDCAMGALQYHIDNLEADGQVISIRNGNSRHFFMRNYSDDENTLMLASMTRNPTIRSILSEVKTEGRITQAVLSRTLDIDKSLVSYYANSLVESGVLRTIRVFGRERPLALTKWADQALTSFELV